MDYTGNVNFDKEVMESHHLNSSKLNIFTMRLLVYSSIFLLFFTACQSEPKTKDNGTGLTTDPPTAKVHFRCESSGEDANEVPHNEVFLVVNDQSTKIADVTACDEITKDSYLTFQIPANAVAACGGWYAGAGDYFYALEMKGKIVVMKGWNAEEQTDEGYHYEQHMVVPIKK